MIFWWENMFLNFLCFFYAKEVFLKWEAGLPTTSRTKQKSLRYGGFCLLEQVTGLLRFASFTALVRLFLKASPAYSRLPLACSQTRFCGFASHYQLHQTKKPPLWRLLFVGAGNGNRTRILSLGSSHSTIELYLRCLSFNTNKFFWQYKIVTYF